MGADAADRLSCREREVLVLMAKGLTRQEIAAELDITVRTARAHVEHIFDKLDAVNAPNAVAIGFVHSYLTATSLADRQVS